MLTTKGKPWHESDGDYMVMPFNVYTVSDSLKPVDANGLTIVPNYNFDNGPRPQTAVIPPPRPPHRRPATAAAGRLRRRRRDTCRCAPERRCWRRITARRPKCYYDHAYQQSMEKKYSRSALCQWNALRGKRQNRNCRRLDLWCGSGAAHRCQILRERGAQVTASFLEYHSELWKNPEYDQVKPVIASK